MHRAPDSEVEVILPDGHRKWRTASPIVVSPDVDRFFDVDAVFVCDPQDGVMRGLRRTTGKVEWSRATGIWYTGNCKMAVDRPDPNGPLEFLVPAEVTPDSPRELPFVRLARRKGVSSPTARPSTSRTEEVFNAGRH
jgi:hypothetical protein